MTSAATPWRRRTTLSVATALVGSLALAACGSGTDSGSGTDKASGDGGTRVVKTVMGEVKVPENPKRVVVLDTAELDSVLSLGVKPVGATHADVATGFLSYLPKDQLSGIENVGNIAAPNLEKIAALKPDLILSSKLRDADRYDELSKIAPTVFAEDVGYPWKENFLLHAEALGKQEEGKKVVAEYEKHAAEVTEALGGKDKAAQTTVSATRFIEGGDIRLYGRKNYIGTVLEDVGLGRPAIVDKAENGFAYEVSPEQIDQADADAVFYTSFGDSSKSGESKILDSSLWKNMKAVKADRAFHVNDDLWFMGIGYTAADKILDELESKLAK
ncbi:iron-siderophore ABC transporter substrate-binding protein [Streptomyces sp. GD-15H]|uniref:ABC transporter substrate-binding protein n=1 Tax=Streptomyces sp. GD-15H TaxID=3129112 RepID=UPI0032535850